ncbi:MAG: hypothetical protein M1822_005140 [Bathelium mastoideum]|nr:MAG: hypothetical protein M1822_005140 [Bathelium mastoideum]
MEYDANTGEGIAPQHPPMNNTAKDSRGHTIRMVGDALDPAPLKESVTFPFSGRTAKNRFLKAPMTERLSRWDTENEDITARGVPNDELTHLYGLWGRGDIGIIVTGNLMVSYDAVEGFGNLIFCDNHDNRLPRYRALAAAAKAHGSLLIAQLSHPGRQGNRTLNPHPVSASDVQLAISWAGNEFAKPRPLTRSEIRGVVESFAESARWCYEAGFDGVQVHCAHGYLLAQFLSLTTNKREDEYGGSLENRARIVFEVIEETRRRVPDPAFIICVKLNSVEFQAGGLTPEDSRKLCVMLEEARVDFVDLSGGTFEEMAFVHKKESTKAREAYFIEFAEMLGPMLKKTKVYVTGGFRTVGGMVRALNDKALDGIGIGSPLSMEPFLCKEILEGKITGAIENKMPLPNQIMASGTQLHQLGTGEEMTSDWSDEGEVKRWLDANDKEAERKKNILPKVDSSGYPHIKAQAGFAYLT